MTYNAYISALISRFSSEKGKLIELMVIIVAALLKDFRVLVQLLVDICVCVFACVRERVSAFTG